MKHLLSVHDLEIQEIVDIYEMAMEFKRRPVLPAMRGKNLALIFQKPSTRTRVSFEVAMNHLGGHAISLNYQDTQLWRGETIGDTSRVLSRYVDGIVARVYSHGDLVSLARNSSVPVINGLSDLLHPCQALSDIFTIYEKFRRLEGLKLAYTGNGRNNITHSLLNVCSMLGLDMSVACPKGLSPDPEVLERAEKVARKSGAKLEITTSPTSALKLAHVVYTDTWFSMGEKRSSSRKRMLKKYQLNSELLENARRKALVMHCLPAHRDEEITDKVIDGPRSLVWDQAENRLHVQKGILSLLL